MTGSPAISTSDGGLDLRWLDWHRDFGGDAASGGSPGSPHQVPILSCSSSQVKALHLFHVKQFRRINLKEAF
jgi:hypothetical protein